MADPGDVVTVDFLGATGADQPNIPRDDPLDYLLQEDWASAGLRQPSAFRALWDGHPDHSAGDWASLST